MYVQLLVLADTVHEVHVVETLTLLVEYAGQRVQVDEATVENA